MRKTDNGLEVNKMEKEIRKYVRAQLNLLAKDDRTLEQSGAKAQLAQLRRGVGKRPGELPELWGMFLKNMPEELMRLWRRSVSRGQQLI